MSKACALSPQCHQCPRLCLSLHSTVVRLWLLSSCQSSQGYQVTAPYPGNSKGNLVLLRIFCTDSLNCSGLTYNFSTSQWYKRVTHSAKTVLSIGNFSLSPGQGPSSLVMLGSGSSQSAPDLKGKQLIYLYPFCPHNSAFHFQYSIL